MLPVYIFMPEPFYSYTAALSSGNYLLFLFPFSKHVDLFASFTFTDVNTES